MDITPRPSISSLSSQTTKVSSQSSIKERYFQYNVLGPGKFRIFKLDLNGEDEPLSGALLTTYHSWNALDLGPQRWKGSAGEETEKVMKKLSYEDTYDTFSYTWGTQDETQPLHLSLISSRLTEGGEVKTNFESYRNGVLYIGANLQALLQELRRRRHKRFIWIDAICINQANDVEKKGQIAMMGDIYEYAGHGYVWLGVGSQGEMAAMRSFQEIIGKLQEACRNNISLSPGKDETFSNADLPEPHEQIWKDLGVIMRNPYWSRLWALQEVVVPERTGGTLNLQIFPPTEVLLGGTTTMLNLFNQFCIAATSLGLRSWIVSGRIDTISRPGSLYGFDGIDEIRTCRQSWGSDLWGVSLRALLLGTRRRKATVAADMVYGMLAMMDKQTAKDLQPAANSSTRDVFVKFAKHYIRNELKENLLNHVATEYKMEGLPTWCPNFGSSPTTIVLGSRWIGEYKINEEDMQMYHAGYTQSGKWKLPRSKLYVLKAVGNVLKGRNQHTGTRDTHDPRQMSFYPDSDYLLVSGMHLDVVAEVVDCNPAADSSEFFSIHNLVQTEEWDKACLGVTMRHLSRELDGFDTYTRTITANRVTIERSSDETMLFDHESKLDFVERYGKFKKFIQDMKKVYGDMTTENLDRDAWHFGDVLSHVTSRRRFFATEGGRIGLGPAETEVGDALAVLFYCPTPYILRHSPSGRGQLVGETYVHGLMYGEALGMFERGELDETKWVLE